MKRRDNMAIPPGKRQQQLRLQLAQSAAQILLDAGNRDYSAAKRKAADRLGVRDQRSLPSNVEIEQALAEHQRIFYADSQPEHLASLRQQALSAMQLLKEFRPRLVGAVLHGTADNHSAIHLHVFSDQIEAVSLFLMDRHIPFELGERRLRRENGEPGDVPALRFVAGEERVELTVLPTRSEHHPPLSPVDGRPMQRADTAAVQQLIQSGTRDEFLGNT